MQDKQSSTIPQIFTCENITHPLIKPISDHEVEESLCKQKSRAPAVSGFSPTNLKSVYSSIMQPLLRTFSYFLESSTFFLEWLHSTVFFIYKGKGLRSVHQTTGAYVFKTLLPKSTHLFLQNGFLFLLKKIICYRPFNSDFVPNDLQQQQQPYFMRWCIQDSIRANEHT